MKRLSVERFVSMASAFYFSAGLPWCLLTVLGCFSGHAASDVALFTALLLWAFIGLLATYIACSPSRSESRDIARCVVAGYLVNPLVVVVGLLVSCGGKC